MDFVALDDKLFELQKACNRYAEVDPLAHWVLYAMTRHINTNRATRAFEQAFLRYPNTEFESMIRKCLNGDRSHDGIISTCKRVLAAYM